MTDLILTKPLYSKTAPCAVKLKEKVLLNGIDSLNKTYHISLDLEEKDLPFLPGDSLGILPENDPELVASLLTLVKSGPEDTILDPRSKVEMTAKDYLLTKVNLSRINSSLLRLLASNGHVELLPLLARDAKEQLQAFLQGKDLIDLFEELGGSPLPLQELAPCFTPLLPRFYSISSSLKAHKNEVHLLVALSSYSHKKGTRYGVASRYLCNLARDTSTISLYVQPSSHFRIPEDSSKDLIMIGPGTGVAPYRAFLQERVLEEPAGKNWIFFGGRHRETDFFYEEFLSSLEKEDKLKISTAFSRDQEEKVYVQHKLLEESKEVWRWLERGSFFYVCGDATKMAKDVEATLLFIIEKEGSLSKEEAKVYFKKLKSDKRYLTDVY